MTFCDDNAAVCSMLVDSILLQKHFYKNRNNLYYSELCDGVESNTEGMLTGWAEWTGRPGQCYWTEGSEPSPQPAEWLERVLATLRTLPPTTAGTSLS